MERPKKLSAHDIWIKVQKEGLSDEQYKQLLIDNKIIVPKEIALDGLCKIHKTMSQNVTPGRIVEFFPNNNQIIKLPNGMTSAPAMVTQTFDSPHVNLCLFTANPNGEATMQAWSIPHKETAVQDQPYWDWFPRV